MKHPTQPGLLKGQNGMGGPSFRAQQPHPSNGRRSLLFHDKRAAAREAPPIILLSLPSTKCTERGLRVLRRAPTCRQDAVSVFRMNLGAADTAPAELAPENYIP
jgi:hypothetical protein